MKKKSNKNSYSTKDGLSYFNGTGRAIYPDGTVKQIKIKMRCRCHEEPEWLLRMIGEAPDA